MRALIHSSSIPFHRSLIHVTSNAQRQEGASAGVYAPKRTPPTPPSPRLLHIYISRVRDTRHPPGTPRPPFRVAGEPATVLPSRFRPPHASHPLDPSLLRLFPLAPAHLLRPIPRTPARFTDHHRTRPASRNNPKLPFFTSALVHSFRTRPRLLSVCLSVSERILPKQPTSCTSHPPATRTPHNHLDPDDIVAATASSCSLRLRSQPLKPQSPHDP